jgi:hypothetical protein
MVVADSHVRNLSFLAGHDGLTYVPICDIQQSQGLIGSGFGSLFTQTVYTEKPCFHVQYLR